TGKTVKLTLSVLSRCWFAETDKNVSGGSGREPGSIKMRVNVFC
ncbi:6588_t:CDS:1, partial [Gigaspora rosea]